MWWFVLAAHAQQTCEKTSIGELASRPLPGVWVLGERKGTEKDLARARKLVLRLAKKGPVTVALQAVRADRQDVLDRYAEGALALERLPAELDWGNTWGFPFDAYAKLLATEALGVKLVAIGQPYELRPADAILPTPPGYMHLLADPMGEAPVPSALEGRMVETVAWADHRFAATALERWSGEGALVIVVDRYHVEGGLGVQWQAQRMTDRPVVAALLANADSRCYPGDLVLP